MTFPVASSALALDVADFNHDGHLDVVVITRGTLAVNVLLGDGAGDGTLGQLARVERHYEGG